MLTLIIIILLILALGGGGGYWGNRRGIFGADPNVGLYAPGVATVGLILLVLLVARFMGVI